MAKEGCQSRPTCSWT